MEEGIFLLPALLLIAFFSGIEIAFVSANKLRVELLKEKGKSNASIVSNFNQNPARFISTMLIGLNISLVLFSSIMEGVLTPENFSFLPAHKGYLLMIETVVTTFIVLIFGELIPKMLFRINADRMLLLFAYPTQLIYFLLTPLTLIFHKLSQKVLKFFVGSDYHEGRQEFTEEDLEYLIKESAASEDKEDNETDNLNSELFEKALYLKEVKVKSCLVPRLEIEGIEADETYEENIDKIIGYVHHFDLLKQPKSIRSIIRAVEVIPASMNAQDLLVQFIKERKNIAWVVDEYGGTAGIITLEDIMEEIFGEIEDEHDVEELIEKKISDTEFIFAARLEVDYLNEEYNLDIPEGEYETLSGFIVMNNEDIPDQGETITIDRFEIKILKASDKRIELVNVKVKEEKD